MWKKIGDVCLFDKWIGDSHTLQRISRLCFYLPCVSINVSWLSVIHCLAGSHTLQTTYRFSFYLQSVTNNVSCLWYTLPCWQQKVSWLSDNRSDLAVIHKKWSVDWIYIWNVSKPVKSVGLVWLAASHTLQTNYILSVNSQIITIKVRWPSTHWPVAWPAVSYYTTTVFLL